MGVFTNIGLLYLKSSDQLYAYYFTGIIRQDQMLWVFLLIIFLIVMLKHFIEKIIPDKPKWVIDEEEERKAQRKQKTLKYRIRIF